MTAFSFIRARDGMAAFPAEALDSGRRLKPGYRFAGSAGGARLMQPGDHLSFDVPMMDAAARAAPVAVTLRDSAGQPVTLRDRDTGASFRLTADLIAAIEAEAGKAGLPVDAYVRDVLRYQPA